MAQQAMSPIERAEAELKKYEGDSGQSQEEEAPENGQQATESEGEEQQNREALESDGSDGAESREDKHKDGEGDEDYKQKWLTVHGMYKRLKDQVDQLKDEKDRLSQKLEETSRGQAHGNNLPDNASQSQIAKHLDSLEDEYGEEFSKAIDSRIDSRVENIINAKVAERIQGLEDKVDATTKDATETNRERFAERLAGKVPDWQQVYQTDQFHGWLAATVEDMSGRTYAELFKEANDAWDLDRMVKLFKAYKKFTGSDDGGGDPPSQSKKDPPVSPGRGKASASAPASPDDKRMWTSDEVNKFYSGVRTGKYSAEDARKIETEILKANAEGRIT